MTFLVPSNNGNLILRYHAVCKSTNGGVGTSQFARGSPFSVNGLTPGGRYSCTLSAINDRGAGPPATPTFVALLSGAPLVVRSRTIATKHHQMRRPAVASRGRSGFRGRGERDYGRRGR